MHLLRRKHDSDDFELVSFIGNEIPPYAILSHTWGDEEITYDELIAGTGKDKAGYAKIRFCGKRAAKDGLEYFWVDTCCINKNSSAELSESINSMYRWYRDASVCYAYIEDWPAQLTWDDLISIIPEYSWEDGRNSKPLRWFTRGWTLQELIAPKKIEFFDATQQRKGRKSDPLVLQHLSRITGVALKVLADINGVALLQTCHAQRMSWAAHRNTTREEDIAYCLLGIFNINMPLLYGEGDKAFVRLQEQILISSTDLSLLAWTQPTYLREYRGIFSYHPREFQDLRNCRLDKSPFSAQPEVVMTNKGARLETSLFHLAHDNSKGGFVADENSQFLCLGCYNNSDYPVGIYIKKKKDFYVRAKPDRLADLRFPTMIRCQPRRIYLARDLGSDLHTWFASHVSTIIHIKFSYNESYMCKVVSSWPAGYFDTHDHAFVEEKHDSFIGYLVISVCNCSVNILTGGIAPFAYFVAVISKTKESGVRLTMLTNDQANSFGSDIELLDHMDSKSAQETLLGSLSRIQSGARPITTVFDPKNKSTLRIEGEVREGIHPSVDTALDTVYIRIIHDGNRNESRSPLRAATIIPLTENRGSEEMDGKKLLRWYEIMDSTLQTSK